MIVEVSKDFHREANASFFLFGNSCLFQIHIDRDTTLLCSYHVSEDIYPNIDPWS
jgi:hypothetical protein